MATTGRCTCTLLVHCNPLRPQLADEPDAVVCIKRHAMTTAEAEAGRLLGCKYCTVHSMDHEGQQMA
jgi:hypothetical protein